MASQVPASMGQAEISGNLYAIGYPAFASKLICTLIRHSAGAPVAVCGIVIPNVITRQIDVFPTKRRKVRQAFGGNRHSLPFKSRCGLLQIHGIPEDDGRRGLGY